MNEVISAFDNELFAEISTKQPILLISLTPTLTYNAKAPNRQQYRLSSRRANVPATVQANCVLSVRRPKIALFVVALSNRRLSLLCRSYNLNSSAKAVSSESVRSQTITNAISHEWPYRSQSNTELRAWIEEPRTDTVVSP